MNCRQSNVLSSINYWHHCFTEPKGISQGSLLTWNDCKIPLPIDLTCTDIHLMKNAGAIPYVY